MSESRRHRDSVGLDDSWPRRVAARVRRSLMKDNIKHKHSVFDRNTNDLRGWPVHDHNDVMLGAVGEVVVDPETSRVIELRLEDGTPIPLARVRRGADVLFLVAPEPSDAPPQASRGPVESQVPEPRGTTDDDVRVQLVTEDLDVGKRRVDAGGIHLETRVVAEPVVRDVALRAERVTVERTQVDRVVSAAEADRLFHDAELDIAAHSDEPVVVKRAHVVEEVVIKKTATANDRVVRDRVRKLDIDVAERDGAAKGGAR
jgi:uncharacterized protein (TIGR02271 family)